MKELIKIDTEGKITTRELYEFLELNPSNYAKWCKANIIENSFAEENTDWFLLVHQEEYSGRGQKSINYKLSIDFAKKLCMISKTERGEQARNYFIEVEKEFKTQQLPIMSQLEIVAATAVALVEQAKRMKQIESMQAETKQRQDQQGVEMKAIRDVVVVRPNQQREWINSTINKIVSVREGQYGKVKAESYVLLNKRMGVNVYTRQSNEMIKTGRNVSIIDIVLKDKKLTEGYIAILKEYAIKYGVAA